MGILGLTSQESGNWIFSWYLFVRANSTQDAELHTTPFLCCFARSQKIQAVIQSEDPHKHFLGYR